VKNEEESEPTMETSTIQAIEDFFGKYRLRRYPKGQILILDGENLQHIFYLTSGRVKAYETSYKGTELVLTIYGPKMFFPVAPLVDRPSQFIYEAETDIEVRQAPLKATVEFLKANPELVYGLLGQLHNRVEDILTRMSHLMASSAKKRLVYELVAECQNFGIPQTDDSYYLAISEKDIGARAGLSRETVSREINKLKREKLVEVRPSNIAILSITELKKHLELIV